MLPQTVSWSPLSAVIPNVTDDRRPCRRKNARWPVDPAAEWLRGHGVQTLSNPTESALQPANAAEVADQYHTAWVSEAAAQEAELFEEAPEGVEVERLVPPEPLVRTTLPDGTPVVATLTGQGPVVSPDDVPAMFAVVADDGTISHETLDFTAAFDGVSLETVAAERLAALQTEAIAAAKQAADAADADLLARLELAITKADPTLRSPEVVLAIDTARAAIQEAERAAAQVRAAEAAQGFTRDIVTADAAMLAEIVHAAQITEAVIGAPVAELIAGAVTDRKATLEREAAIAAVRDSATAALAAATSLTDIAAVEATLKAAEKQYGVAFIRPAKRALSDARQHVQRQAQRRALQAEVAAACDALTSASTFDDIRKIEAELRAKEAGAEGLRLFTPRVILSLQAARQRIAKTAVPAAPAPTAQPARAAVQRARPAKPAAARQPTADLAAVEDQALIAFAIAKSAADVAAIEKALRAANKQHRHNFFTPAMLAARAEALRRLRQQSHAAAAEATAEQTIARLAAAQTSDEVRACEKELNAARKQHHRVFTPEVVAALAEARRRCRVADLTSARETVAREARMALQAAKTRDEVLAVERFLSSANKQYRRNFFTADLLAEITSARRRCRPSVRPGQYAAAPVAL